MLVSVLIPVYNVEAYVEGAIRSILEQTYQNLEIIIIDDCSTDRTHEICLQLRHADSRIRVYRNESNRRISFSLNRAFSESRGDLIVRMDGDDISDIERIDRFAKFLNENMEYDLVGCSVIAIDTNGRQIGKTVHYADMQFLVRSAKFMSPCSHIWAARRRVYEALQGYRNMPGVEDYDFVLRAIDCGFKITNIEDYFGYKVRLGRSGNTVSTIGARQRLLQEYVYCLHIERQKYGFDTHTDEFMSKATSQGTISANLFRLSNYFLQHALRANGLARLPLRVPCLILSLVSPIQAKYIYSRLRYRLMCFGAKL